MKKQNNIPMGVSAWREHGIRYKYWDFFVGCKTDEVRKEVLRKLMDIMRKKYLNNDAYNNFFIDMCGEIKEIVNPHN